MLDSESDSTEFIESHHAYNGNDRNISINDLESQASTEKNAAIQNSDLNRTVSSATDYKIELHVHVYVSVFITACEDCMT